jgi:CheY-like chemotaxis protein
MLRTVLIVDDTHSCGDTLALALADLPDLEIRIVTSALEALRLAETIPLAGLVTDLHMPRIDGFELIERIRSQPRFATIPIFVISGDSDVDTPRRLRHLGADAFFAKPFSPYEVRQALERCLYTR